MLIKKSMNLDKLNNSQLALLHSKLHSMWKQKQKGEDVEIDGSWSKEDIWNLHKRLVEKMNSKDIAHKKHDDLDEPLKYSDHTAEFLNSIEDATILRDAVNLTGSFVENKDYNDIDILLRLPDIDYIRRAIFARLKKTVDKKFMDKVHAVEESEGPHANYIPIYDLVLKKRKPELVKMSANKPQKPSDDAFYDMDELIKEMFKKHSKWLIEKKWDGFHVKVKKNEDDVKVITEDGTTMEGLKTFPDKIKKLSEKDFEIDGELIYYKNGELGSRRDLMDFIKKDSKSDKNVGIVCWDITKYGDKDLTELPLTERKEYLDKLNWQEHIKQTKFSIAESESEAKNIIEKKAKLEKSEGAIVKKDNTKYESGASTSWLKYRKVSTIKARVLDVNKTKGGNYNYLVGIDVSKDDRDKIIDKYLKDDKLELGRTFNTDTKAEVGDIIEVQVEEVWRHEKDGKIRYSIHKPIFKKKSSEKSTSSISDLDKIVVSLGVAVEENEELKYKEGLPFAGFKNFDECVKSTMAKKDWDKERASAYCAAIQKKVEKNQEKSQLRGPNDKPIKDFPSKLQKELNKIKEAGSKPPFVIHHHERGESLHTDIRLGIPKEAKKGKIDYDEMDHLYGFTIASPASIDDEDEVDNNADNVLVVEIKPVQPKVWLKVEGKTEKGEPGSTKHEAGIFTIVGKGTYEIKKVSDHKIAIKFNCDKGKIKNVEGRKRKEPENLKDLADIFSFTINHIGDRHVGFLNHVKSAELQHKNDKYLLKLRQNIPGIMESELKGFDGINITYGLDCLKRTVKAIEFDNKIWTSDRVKLFLKRYGNQILNFSTDSTDEISELLPNAGKEKIVLDAQVHESLSEFKMPFEINFTALKEGKFNGVYYTAEELKKAAQDLIGKDLTIDHGKSVTHVVGKIKDAWYNAKNKSIEGKGIIKVKDIAQLIYNKLIKGVSVEVLVDYIKGSHGVEAKNLDFCALSIVRDPACKSCNIKLK